ncbi:unnamed protein product [Paramecium pentaurelia]|uniref:Uncharacterized protein n=1 Tax=Paramecium pentaurelia TaxID=43138 RepID=A0A8S1V1D5_9CILI|nr:unnamed protein product [Paramecium pentaurelia]
MNQDSICQTHNQPTIGYYYDQEDMPHQFCSGCSLVNSPYRRYSYQDMINDKSKINDQKQRFMQILTELIEKQLEYIESINKKFKILIEEIKSECIVFGQKLEQMRETVQNEYPLRKGQITKLLDFQNYNINLVNNEIYTLCNQYFEDHYQNIYNTSQGNIQSLFTKMQNGIPQLLNTKLINNSDQKNLALYNLELNQFIDKQVQSLKNKIQEICQENAQLQDNTKRDQFYFKIESDKYYIKDISQLFIDIRNYIDISSQNIFYQSDIEKQLNDFMSAKKFEAQNNDQTENNNQTENNDSIINFSDDDDFYIQNEQIE